MLTNTARTAKTSRANVDRKIIGTFILVTAATASAATRLLIVAPPPVARNPVGGRRRAAYISNDAKNRKKPIPNMIDAVTQKQHRMLNLAHTWLLVGGSLALFVVCAWLFFGPSGIWFALVFGGVSLFVATRISPRIVLRMYRAAPVSRDRFPVGHALLDRLVERAGLRHRPTLYIMPSRLMNAFAVGSKQEAAICMTDRLVRSLSARELAGVMAHEVAHIASEDLRVMAVADMVSRFTSVLSTLGIVSVFINLPAILMGMSPQIPWLAVAVLVAAPTIGALLQLALSRTREYDADLSAAMLTGDPDGLASALLKLERAQGRHWEGMVLPGGRQPDPSLLRTHPRTENRIERLMALKEMADIGDPLPPPPDLEPQRRRRPVTVPDIGQRWPLSQQRRYRSHAPLLGLAATAPLVDEREAGRSACAQSLNAPKDGPRFRIGCGGVYW